MPGFLPAATVTNASSAAASIVVDIDVCLVGLLAELRGWKLRKRYVHKIVVVTVSELTQFSLKVKGVSERHVIQIFASNGADHSLSERT